MVLVYFVTKHTRANVHTRAHILENRKNRKKEEFQKEKKTKHQQHQ